MVLTNKGDKQERDDRPVAQLPSAVYFTMLRSRRNPAT